MIMRAAGGALRARVLAAACAAAAAAAAAPPISVVDLTTAQPPPSVPTLLAVQACAGLFNRNASVAGAAYTLMRPEDAAWLAIAEPSLPAPPPTTPVADFLAACVSRVAAGWIRYDYAAQQAIVPNLLTLAGVLDAVPFEAASPFLPPGARLVFDAQAAWAGFSPLNATAYMYAAHVARTTTMAMMDPGYDFSADPLAPPLTRSPDLGLGDLVVSARLFDFFMLDACVNGTAEHALMEAMVASNPWPRPVAVLGYNDAFPVAGDIFEAETDCVAGHGLGQVATSGVNNLAFFSSRWPPITAPLSQPAAPPVRYDGNKTYLGLVVGDGDNIAMVKTDRFHWFSQRAAACTAAAARRPGGGGGAAGADDSDGGGGGGGGGGSAPRLNRGGGPDAGPAPCFPLMWTLSPHLLTLAPPMIRWFFDGAAATGADYFVLPPSGHLYAYPSQMGPADADAFVAATEDDCRLMNCSSTVAWEFAGTWPNAFEAYFPRYGARGVVRSFFAVNVPYMIPVVEFGADEYAKVLPPRPGDAGPVVVFKPNEWRGTTGGALLPPFMLNASAFAALINSYPRGTVAHIYMTSDGGAKLSDFSDLVALLDSHVQVVNPRALGELAVAGDAERRRRRGAAAADGEPAVADSSEPLRQAAHDSSGVNA